MRQDLQKFLRYKNVLEVLYRRAKFGGARISPATGVAKTLSFLTNVRYMLLPVRLSSVTFMRPTQAFQIFSNISTALGTLAIH